MDYKFICPKCNETKTLKIPITEYTSEGHFCDCGTEMKRDANDFCRSYKRSCDGFFGVSKNN